MSSSFTAFYAANQWETIPEWEFLMPKLIRRAAIYIRVSDPKQEKKYSPQFQREKTLAHCHTHTFSITEEHIFKETYTGKVWRQRPALAQMLQAAKRHEFDVLVMYRLDRFSRDRNDQIIIRELLQHYGVTTITLDPEEHADDDSLAGEIIRSVYGFQAEIERKKIIERTQDGLRSRVQDGKLLTGRRPLYGYRWDNEQEKSVYVIKPSEASVVRRIFAMFKSGLPLRTIARILTDEGIPTPNGNTLWRHQSIQNILANPFYIGKACAYKRQYTFIPGEGVKKNMRPEEEWVMLPEGTVPALIDPVDFTAVQEQLQRNKQNAARNNKHPEDMLLRCGMVVCGYCQKNMTVEHRNTEGWTCYVCTRGKDGYRECQGGTIGSNTLDTAVWQRAVEIILDPTELEKELRKRSIEDPTKDDLKTLDGLIAKTIKKIQNLTETIEDTTEKEARSVLTFRLSELTNQKGAFEEKRDAILRHKYNWMEAQQALADFKQWCDEVREDLTNPAFTPPYAEKRNACEKLGIKAIVWRRDHTRRFSIETSPPSIMAVLCPYVAVHPAS